MDGNRTVHIAAPTRSLNDLEMTAAEKEEVLASRTAKSVIGSGGSFVVYRGMFRGVPVAVKKLGAPVESGAFAKEATAVAGLVHAHLMQIKAVC